MFILNQMQEASTYYNISSATIIQGNLDINKIEMALKRLVKRHDSLRTTFEYRDDELVQIIHDNVKFDVVYQEKEREDIEEFLKGFVRPFSLNKAPLFRVAIVKTTNERYILLTDMPHIITDGASINIIINELVSLYQGEELPEMQLQYKDYAVWQNKLFNTGHLRKQEEYWLNLYKEQIPVLELPTDYPLHEFNSAEGDTLYFEVKDESVNQIKKMMSETGITMFMILFGVYNALLYRYTGRKDIAVGVAISGRTHADLEGIVGMFVNTLAIRNHLDDNNTFKELLEGVKNNVLKAFENQEYPFEVLVEKLKLSNEKGRNPLFDTMFIMQNDVQREIQAGSLKLVPYNSGENASKFHIMLNAYEGESKICFSINYCTSLFKKESIKKFSEDYVRILKYVLQNDNIRIGDIELSNDLFVPKVKPLDVDFNLTGI